MSASPSIRSRRLGSTTTLVVLLCALNLLNYIDRQAVTGLLEPIRKDLGGTDAQMGFVGSAFVLTYTFMPPVFGWLGDRVARTRLLGVSAGIWCAATAICGLVANLGQLAGARAAVGIGEASYMANTPSLLSDLFPPARRGAILSLFYSAAPIGSALGVALGGLIASRYGWRAACFVVGLPGLAVAVVLYLSPEPPRGRYDAVSSAVAPPFLDTVRLLSRNAPFVLIVLGIAAQIFAQNAVEYWLPTVLQRDKAIPLSAANATYGLVVLVAGITGPLSGALIGDWLAKRTTRAYYYVSSTASFLVTLPLFVIAVAAARVPLFAGVLVEALFGNMATGLVLALAVNAVAPGVRATATAVLLTTAHLLGDAISWPLVGSMSTAMQSGRLERLVNVAASLGVSATSHLTIALISVTIPAVFMAGLLYLSAARAHAVASGQPA